MQNSVLYMMPVVAVIAAAALAGHYLETVSANSNPTEAERARILDPGSMLLDPTDRETTPHRVALSAEQRKTVTALVEEKLRDPDSAQFYPLMLPVLGYKDGRQLFEVCGMVNAKNGFGGYVGKDAFVLTAWPTSYPQVEFGDDAVALCEHLASRLGFNIQQ
jgi:hypothetical protein